MIDARFVVIRKIVGKMKGAVAGVILREYRWN